MDVIRLIINTCLVLREVPSPDKEDLSQVFITLPETADYAALIFEQEGKHSVGKKIILDMNKHSDVVPVC